MLLFFVLDFLVILGTKKDIFIIFLIKTCLAVKRKLSCVYFCKFHHPIAFCRGYEINFCPLLSNFYHSDDKEAFPRSQRKMGERAQGRNLFFCTGNLFLYWKYIFVLEIYFCIYIFVWNKSIYICTEINTVLFCNKYFCTGMNIFVLE